LILRGIFLLRDAEIQFFYQEGSSWLFPEAHAKLSNILPLTKLDFISLLRILHVTYVYSVFASPRNSHPFIEKVTFLRAIKEDRLPNKFDEREIIYLYSLIAPNHLSKAARMDFESFVFFFNLYKLFNKYAKENPLYLTRANFLELLNDPLTPKLIVSGIDNSQAKFTKKDFDQAYAYLQRPKADENAFFYGFKQVEDFDTYYDYYYLSSPKKNDVARNQVFSAMCGLDKKRWNKFIFYRSFQLMNFFVSLTHDQRQVIPSTEILQRFIKYVDIIAPPISTNHRDNYAFYQAIPRDVNVDLFLFLQIREYPQKLRQKKQYNFNNVQEAVLRVALKDMGDEMISNSIIDTAMVNYDNLNRKTYDVTQVIKLLIAVHGIAAERKRTFKIMKDNGIKDSKQNQDNEAPIEEELIDGLS